MRINQVTKYIRSGYWNKAGEGNDLGMPEVDLFAGGDKEWDLSSTSFVDDTQDLTNLGSEDILQPDLNNADFDDELNDEGGEEEGGEEDEDEDPDDDNEEGDESETESDESEEEKDDDSSDESDEDADDGTDSADSDNDADSDGSESETDVTKSKKSDEKYISEIARLRRRAQTSENQLATLQKAIKNGGDEAVKNKIAALTTELDTVEDGYEDAVMDGDRDKARELRDKRRTIQDEINGLKTGSISSLQGELSAAQAEVKNALNEALNVVYQRYPVLDPSSDTFNQQMINIINGMATQKRQAGSGVLDAVLDAVEEGALLLQLKPQGESEEATEAKKKSTKRRNQKAVEKRIDAVKKAKRSTNSKRVPTKRVDAKNVKAMTDADFGSAEGRKALKEEFGIRFDA